MSLKESKATPKWAVRLDEKGRIAFYDTPGWQKYKAQFHGKDAELILKKKVKSRSRQEERYYWGVVVERVSEALGTSRDAAHELMAGLFLRIEETSPAGIRYNKVMSTTELGDERYDRYIFKECVPWASTPTDEETGLTQESGLGLFIPLPNEVDYENL